MTQKSPRYRIIRFIDSDGDTMYKAQRNIFGVWIDCRWFETAFHGPTSMYLETVEKYIEAKLNPQENPKDVVVKIYE